MVRRVRRKLRNSNEILSSRRFGRRVFLKAGLGTSLGLAGGGLLAACDWVLPESPAPTPVPVETPADIPDDPSPTPIATPEPAQTPTPVPEPSPTPEPVEQVLRVAHGAALPADLLDRYTDADCPLGTAVRSGLTRITNELELEPDWAIEWATLTEEAGWRFRIRENADGWGEGVPLTALDFARAWRRVLQPENSNPFTWLLADIELAGAYAAGEVGDDELGIDVVDDWTLDVRLSRSRVSFPVLAATRLLAPVPPDDLDPCIDNGLFRFDGQANERITLVPNEFHWEFGDSEVARLELVDDSDVHVVNEFRFANLDLVRVHNNDVPRVRSDDAVADRMRAATPGSLICLIPQVSHPPFNDPAVRRAISKVIDRRRLELIVEGRLAAAYRFFPGGLFPELDDALAGEGADFNVDEAYDEIAQSLYPIPAEWPRFGLDIPSTNTYQDRIARDIAAQLNENLDITVPVRVHDPERHEEGLRQGEFALTWLEWTYRYADPASGYGELFPGDRAASDVIDWQDPDYDELAELADSLDNPAARAQAYARCEEMLLEEGVYVPIAHPVSYFLVQSWISGLPYDDSGRLIPPGQFGTHLSSRVSVIERP